MAYGEGVTGALGAGVAYGETAGPVDCVAGLGCAAAMLLGGGVSLAPAGA